MGCVCDRERVCVRESETESVCEREREGECVSRLHFLFSAALWQRSLAVFPARRERSPGGDVSRVARRARRGFRIVSWRAWFRP